MLRGLIGLFVLTLCFPTIALAQTPASGEKQSVVYGPGITLVPQGDAGKVSVVATGPMRVNTVPVIIRNATNKDVAGVKVHAQVRNSANTLIGAGDGDVTPYLVPVHGLAIGYIVIDGDFPSDAKYTFTVESVDPPGLMGDYFVALNVTEAGYFGDRVVGTWTNPAADTLANVWGHVACLDHDAVITGIGNANPDGTIAPNGSISFQFDSVYGGTLEECDNFIVVGYGSPEPS